MEAHDTVSRPDITSLQTALRAARSRAQTSQSVEVPLPDIRVDLEGAGETTLVARFRAIDDFKEARAIAKRHEKVREEAEQELLIAADVLVSSNEATFIRTEKFGDLPIDAKFGVELAEWLGEDVDGCTDVQAVFLLFPKTVQIATLAGQVNQFTSDAGRRADLEAEGNS